jgi:hypothetical protein
MDKFYLDPRTVYSILKEKGVKNLYHANTVLTSLTFINNNALLSRNHVEQNGLIQTIQKSDPEDKKFNVWDDVFLDGEDLHKRYKRANFYGPILFVIKPELLLSPSAPKLLITRDNPMYWKDDNNWEKRYYSDPSEMKEDYLSGKKLDSRVMFTFRAPEKTIKMNKFLDHIIMDDPAVIIKFDSGDKNIGERVYKQIETTLQANGVSHIPIKIRHKDEGFYICSCRYKYTWMRNLDYTEFRKRLRINPPEDNLEDLVPAINTV